MNEYTEDTAYSGPSAPAGAPIPGSVEIVLSGVMGLEYGGKPVPNGVPFALPLRDGAALVRAYPEHISFNNEAVALQLVRAMAAEDKRQSEELAIVKTGFARATPIDSAKQAADREAALAKKAALELALKGES